MDDAELKRTLLRAQEVEVTEHAIYRRLARAAGGGPNAEVLARIAADEREHAALLARHTGANPRARRLQVWFYTGLARLFGLTFALRLMERGEVLAERGYRAVAAGIPDLARLAEDEDRHEQALLDLIEEERLKYSSSVVLGLNDALVELTGALAGMTLALGSGRIIAMAGLITGVSAALSMAASEYLSQKAEADSGRDPRKSALYTGVAYVLAVAVLIAPYLVLSSPFHALGCTLVLALALVVGFTFYLSVARNRPFRESAVEMAMISLGVAAVSFGIGFVVRQVLGVEA